MKAKFCLIRGEVTSTSMVVDVAKIDHLRRWILSSIRNSGKETEKYHFVAFGDLSDISCTDRLEEITGGATGVVYDVINKREVAGSHLEFDLELHGTA